MISKNCTIIITLIVFCYTAGISQTVANDTSDVTVPVEKKNNYLNNPIFSISSSLIYSSSSNIKDDYIFPGLNVDLEILYHLTWPSDSLGFGFKTSYNRINFDDNFTISKLILIDFHLLFLNTWGELYNVPILYQPYLGYTLLFNNNISHKVFFSYGSRITFKPPSWKKFSILIDGQMINTQFNGDPFKGTLVIVYFGVKYKL